jgi:hypothetical protein
MVKLLQSFFTKHVTRVQILHGKNYGILGMISSLIYLMMK